MFATARRPGRSVKSAAAQFEAIDRSQAVIAFGLDGTVRDANANFLALMGYGLEEVRGRHHRMFVDPEEAGGEAYAAFWAALRRGECRSAEFRRLAKGGREVWIRASYAPVLDARGRPAGVVKFALDVTAETLAAAGAAGQIAAINRSQAVIRFDLDGTIRDANANFLAALGYELDEIRGRHHRLFVDPAEAASPGYAAFWEALSRGEYRAGEYRRLGKGGREVWIQASYNPILDASGRPVAVVKYAADVTAAKRVAADMAGQVEAASRSQAVIHFDMDGHVLDANANFLAAMGYGIEEIRGRHHRMFVMPAQAESPAYAAFWERLRAGEYSSAVYQRVGKGGREVWIQASYNPVLDAGGRPFKVVKYALDITNSMTVRSRAIAEAEQTLSRVQSVAASAEEMHRTSGAIAAQMEQSRRSVDDIQGRVEAAGAASARLGEAAAAMTGVVDAITSIAEQINLLALNATIEAARAGAAGRGFAVVAAEVKNLAGQAQAATTRISGEITAMQTVSREVGDVLGTIRAGVEAVQGFIAETAGASERQRATTGEVSANVQTTAAGVAGIARNLDEWIVGVDERRADERVRTAISATIELAAPAGGRVETVPCIVLNISETGAKLAVGAPNLPALFALRIEAEAPRRCRVMRRGEGELGVAFV